MAGIPNNQFVLACESCPCFSNTMRMCECGLICAVRSSFTPLHPFRRYATCPNAGTTELPQCTFFDWVDPPMCERLWSLASAHIVSTSNLARDLDEEREKTAELESENEEVWGLMINAETKLIEVRRRAKVLQMVVAGLLVLVAGMFFNNAT